jgi:hypothetical protein
VAAAEKRALKEGRTIVFADQSGFYLLPMVVRTYAPVGETPILHENFTRDHLSAMSGITLEGKLYMIEQDRCFYFVASSSPCGGGAGGAALGNSGLRPPILVLARSNTSTAAAMPVTAT